MNSNNSNGNDINFSKESGKEKIKNEGNSYQNSDNYTTEKISYILALVPVFITLACGLSILFTADGIDSIFLAIFIIVILGGFSGWMSYLIIKGLKEYKETKSDLFNELHKNYFSKIKQEKIGNIYVREKLIAMIFIFVTWILILSLFNVEKDVFFSVVWIILFPIVPLIVQIIYGLTREKRIIKKYDINLLNNTFDIESIKSFNIFDLKNNVYYIVDQNKNLLFKLKKENTRGTKFAICNSEDIKIAEIESSFFINKFKVKQMNTSPFIISENEYLSTEWTITGRNYYVTGDCNLSKKMNYDKDYDDFKKNVVYDKNNNEIAVISKSTKEHIFYKLHNREIILNNDIKNSIDIVAIAICITLGNISNERIIHNRNMSD